MWDLPSLLDIDVTRIITPVWYHLLLNKRHPGKIPMPARSRYHTAATLYRYHCKSSIVHAMLYIVHRYHVIVYILVRAAFFSDFWCLVHCCLFARAIARTAVNCTVPCLFFYWYGTVGIIRTFPQLPHPHTTNNGLYKSSFFSLFFVCRGLGFEFYGFVAGWRHTLRSEWPFIFIIITRNPPV